MLHSGSGGDILKCGLTFPIGLFEHFDLLGLRTSFIFQRDPNPLFDVPGYLLALAIHDSIFAVKFRDVADRYVPDRSSAA